MRIPTFLLSHRPVRTILRRAGLMLALAALSAAGASRAHAQEARQITFNEAVRIALEQNITLKRAANVAELQAIDVARERSNFLPSLNFGSGGQQRYGRNFLLEEGRLVNETTESVGAEVRGGLNLFNGFGDVASYRQAQLQMQAGDLQFERARQTVVFTVMSNFLDLIERREQIKVQEENLEAQRQQLAQIEEFVRVGTRPISDLYQQQAAVANAELNLLNAQQRYQISEANLIGTLQLDPFGAYEFQAPSVEEVDLTLEQHNMNTLLQQAFERRADLRAGEASIRAAQQGIRVARSSYFPSISMNVNYGSNYIFGTQAPSFWDQLDQARGGAVGLSFSVPLFDRFNTRNSIQQARVQYRNARLELEDLQQDIALQVRQAYLDYQTAAKSLEVAETQERAATLALEAAQERYNVGAATLVELSQARASYVQAVSARVQATYDVLFQDKLIEYYLGVLDPGEPLF